MGVHLLVQCVALSPKRLFILSDKIIGSVSMAMNQNRALLTSPMGIETIKEKLGRLFNMS